MPDKKSWLSVVICTRNRPDDLKRCVSAIAGQSLIPKINIDVLIVDDGNLDSSTLNEIRNELSEYYFNYIKKERLGLLLSRIFALSIIETEYILFLDDDVVIEKNYLEILKRTTEQNPKIVGISGIDLLINKPNVFKRIYHTLFLLKSYDFGKLSITGYGESMQYWQFRKQKFSTDFLSGCNMTFKRKSLLLIQAVEWLNSYSLGEDVYLSYIANSCGELIVNPELKVNHFQSKTSRDKLEEVSYTEIVNHYFLLKMRNAPDWKLILHGWTIFGIILKNLFSLNFGSLKGYFSAVLDLLKRKNNFKILQIL